MTDTIPPKREAELLALPSLYLDGDNDLCCGREGDNLVACAAIDDCGNLLNTDLWKALPSLQSLARQQHDRIASLEAEVARLTAERDAAEERGAERMRKRAVQIAMAAHEMWWRRSVPTAFHACDEVAKAIRALPLRDTPAPDSNGEG